MSMSLEEVRLIIKYLKEDLSKIMTNLDHGEEIDYDKLKLVVDLMQKFNKLERQKVNES